MVVYVRFGFGGHYKSFTSHIWLKLMERIMALDDGLKIGQLFESADEAVAYVERFAERNYHPLRQRNNVTVTSYNKKVNMN